MYRHKLSTDTNEINDNRFRLPSIGKGNEFYVAVKSCHDFHPEIPKFLFTNVPYVHKDIRKMLYRAYLVDLMRESGLDKLYEQTKDALYGFGVKPQALLSGWAWGVLPEKVLLLDIDIVLMSRQKIWNLHAMLEPLRFYDVAGVMEGYAVPQTPPGQVPQLVYEAVGYGWELNTGALALNQSAMGLLQQWIECFKRTSLRYSSGDQQCTFYAVELVHCN